MAYVDGDWRRMKEDFLCFNVNDFERESASVPANNEKTTLVDAGYLKIWI